MRELPVSLITEAIARLCIEAATKLPPELCQAICTAREREQSPVGQAIFDDMIANYQLAAETGLPICQDTGMAVVFLELGQEVHLTGGSLREAVDKGVRIGYRDGLLRKSVVGDPLRRVNTEDNTPAVLHLSMIDGDQLRITVAPKGFGSENMSAMRCFTPSATREDVEDFIRDTMAQAGSNPCPPVILGVGLGGTIEQAALLAKQALLRPVGQPNPDPYYAELEQHALAKVNALGIGPQGLGGTVTALAVHVLTAPTHIAGLPCVINTSCHVTRHAEAVL